MSHRISTKTKITDRDVAVSALQSQGWTYSVSGSSITITSGPMRNATINLTSGEVFGDSDHVRREALTSLNQAYGVALCEKTVAEQGGYIEERETLDNGSIRLVVNSSLA